MLSSAILYYARERIHIYSIYSSREIVGDLSLTENVKIFVPDGTDNTFSMFEKKYLYYYPFQR